MRDAFYKYEEAGCLFIDKETQIRYVLKPDAFFYDTRRNNALLDLFDLVKVVGTCNVDGKDTILIDLSKVVVSLMQKNKKWTDKLFGTDDLSRMMKILEKELADEESDIWVRNFVRGLNGDNRWLVGELDWIEL